MIKVKVEHSTKIPGHKLLLILADEPCCVTVSEHPQLADRIIQVHRGTNPRGHGSLLLGMKEEELLSEEFERSFCAAALSDTEAVRELGREAPRRVADLNKGEIETMDDFDAPLSIE